MLKVATIAGIPIKIHWTFLFTILIIASIVLKHKMDLTTSMLLSLFVVILFVLVIMHEYGHALMARRFHIKTRDIIITPIGGIARLEGMPKRPVQELLVAFAGPFVNLFLALIFFGVLYAMETEDFFLREKESIEVLTDPVGFIFLIAMMNTILFVFNLFPAYPMDGGRILRALLSMKMSRRKATIIAANVGRVLSIGFIIFGAYNRMITLLFIGIFIYFVATREYQMARVQLSEN